ncbi:SpoIIE family protein phosphatase [Streptomyces arenae]|uniref:SpoIIE family protein phosphatase n=1 Tax=Streptomyces arenae TaxID=29301 RepID=UPI00265AA81B|nr:SpoIIE family protein phosphatase [Streptomyces arenae]MCG7207218.1 SpoIIE family protein phosphatase [Streptomyces arenae]
MSRRVAQHSGATESLDAALLQVVQESAASRGLLYVLPPGADALWLTALTGGPREMAVPWTRVGLTDRVAVADAVRDRRLVWVGDMEEMARRYPRTALVLPYDFALAAGPLLAGDAPVGGLVLLWPGAHPPRLGAGERTAVEAGCRRLGELLGQAPEERVRPASQPRSLPHPSWPRTPPADAGELAAFIERLPGGACALDGTGRFTFLTPEAARILGADPADLLGTLPWEALPWLDVAEVEDRYRRAVMSEQPTSFTAVRPPGTLLVFELYPDPCGISVRIIRAGLGADPLPEPPRLAADPADSTAGPGRASLLYHLMHLAGTLTEAVGAQDVVNQAADQLMPALGATAMALMAQRDGRLRILGHRGYEAELMEYFDDLQLTEDTPAVRVLETGAAEFFTSFEELREAYPHAVHLDGKSSWAFLPLVASGRAIGSLVLAYDRPQHFPPAERAALTALVGLVGQALERGRLYDTQYAVAHRLQGALLPQRLPSVPGLSAAARYRPAGHGLEVGGDFYDLIRLDDDRAAAVIGDVQGHDIDAAALMGQVRTAVHGHAATGAAPGEVLGTTNRLLGGLDSDRFASCLYAHLDLARGQICLASAGHPPAVLRHPDGRTDVLRVPAGLLLGIERQADYPAVQHRLPAGSVLVLYTDGLIEHPGLDPDDAVAALARLVARTDPTDLDRMADRLLDHAGDPADDVALLLIRPEPPDAPDAG